MVNIKTVPGLNQIDYNPDGRELPDLLVEVEAIAVLGD